ncbi:glycoside hydrolase family 18 protein [Fodinibius sp. AD559]|uniref:glycoside hydrolase family 18 protein n=1 Tax=Fodinibius sp. AD559 TaxID=3424179 RepID=UPI004046F15B
MSTTYNSIIKGSFLLILVAIITVSCDLLSNQSGRPVNNNLWVNGYLASWQYNAETQYANTGIIKTDDIDWDAITHLTFFALSIGPDGTPTRSLEPEEYSNFNHDQLRTISEAAHAHDTNILFSIGGGGNYNGFSSAITDSNRTRFITTILDLLIMHDFDGINLNMVPIVESDYTNYSNFVQQLSRSFDTTKTANNERPLLTLSALKSDSLNTLYASLQDHFDQINILSYDMAQPWRGWQAWHKAALKNKNEAFDANPSLRFPSVDEKVKNAIAAGIKREKIGVGISFSTYLWTMVNYLETWPGWPTQDMDRLEVLTYSQLVNKDTDPFLDSLDNIANLINIEEINLAETAWDNNALVPYLNLENPKAFISFENERSVKEKVKYARHERLGGVMIWELGIGFLQNKPEGEKDPLLKAIKEEAFKNRTDGL